MVRIILGSIAGFIAWNVVWLGSEKLLSAIWPDWYGAHQIAFENAVINGGDFSPDTTILIMNIVRGSLIAVMSGYLAALIARENRRSPLILAVLLGGFAVLIMAMSKSYIPLWYPIIFTALLIPTTLWGGKLKQVA